MKKVQTLLTKEVEAQNGKDIGLIDYLYEFVEFKNATKEAKTLLGCGRSKMFELLQYGLIKGRVIDNRLWIETASIKAYKNSGTRRRDYIGK